MTSIPDLIVKVDSFQNMLISCCTGGTILEDEFQSMRRDILSESLIRDRLPKFVVTVRYRNQFWPYMQRISSTYAGRREYIYEQFNPIIDFLENLDRSSVPSDKSVSEALKQLDSSIIKQLWAKALQRKADDPEGAITASRTLLETLFKYILDQHGEDYGENPSLADLYYQVSNNLQMAPGQKSDKELRRICGAITVIIEGIGNLRNIYGDAHGKGARSETPNPRDAELAVNLSGSLATFIMSIWESTRNNSD